MRVLATRAALVSERRIAGYPDARAAEAAIVGAAAALVADDYIVPGPREAAVALHRGLQVAALAAQITATPTTSAADTRLPETPCRRAR